jgi:hypothetical protein
MSFISSVMWIVQYLRMVYVTARTATVTHFLTWTSWRDKEVPRIKFPHSSSSSVGIVTNTRKTRHFCAILYLIHQKMLVRSVTKSSMDISVFLAWLSSRGINFPLDICIINLLNDVYSFHLTSTVYEPSCRRLKAHNDFTTSLMNPIMEFSSNMLSSCIQFWTYN